MVGNARRDRVWLVARAIVALGAAALIFACENNEAKNLREQIDNQQRIIESQRTQIATLSSKDTSPPGLTRDLARSLIAKNVLFAAPLSGPGFENCRREIVGIIGIAHETATLVIVDLTWRPIWLNRDASTLTPDERTVADHMAISRAELRLFDDGWRVEKISNLKGGDDGSPDTMRFLMAELRIMDKAVERPR